MSESRYYLVTVGAHGQVSADGLSEVLRDRPPSSSRLSTYDTLTEFLAGPHRAELVEGCVIVDLTPLADMDGLMTAAWRAPLVDVKLGGDEINRWRGDNDPDGFAAVIAGSWFGAAGVAAAVTTTTGAPGPFDNVSPGRVGHYWAQFGARVGVWHDGEVVWHEPPAPEPPAEQLAMMVDNISDDRPEWTDQ